MRELYRKEGGAFPDPILNLDLELHRPDQSQSGGTGQGHERPGAGRSQGRDRRGHGARRQAARRLRPAARRRHDRVRLLDLLRLLYREGQPDGAARRDRPARAGHRSELGVGVAGQPADHVQPRQRRSRRQALEPGQADHRMERQAVDRHRRARLHADHEAVRWRRSVHHERRGRRTPVRARPDGGRPVPRALRAVRVAVAECPASEGDVQSGGAGVCRRPGSVRQRGGVSVCRAPPTG